MGVLKIPKVKGGETVMKHNPMATANAAVVTALVLYVVCAIAIGLSPEFSMMVAQSWFHGLVLSKIAGLTMTPTSLVIGAVSISIYAWVLGFVFANTYNYFSKK